MILSSLLRDKTCRALVFSASILGLVACGGGGGNASAPGAGPGSNTNPTTTGIAGLTLVPSKSSVKADGQDSLTLTVRALDASNAIVKGANLTVSASSGLILSASNVTTDATTGTATVTVTADANNPVNRTATVTLSCGGCGAANATNSIAITGATLSLAGGTSLVAGGTAQTLDAVLKDPSGNNVPDGTTVTFSSADTTTVTVSPATQTTVAGKATVSVTGIATTSGSGTTVTASALGSSASRSYTVSAPANALAISAPSNTTSLVVGVAQTITVAAPGASSVTFFNTANGTWSSAGAVTVSGNVATNDFTPAQAGSLTITVKDNSNRTASVTYSVSAPISAVNKLQASAGQTTLQVAVGTTTPSVRITTMALTSAGQGVANVPIMFTFSGGPGAGEYLTPALAYTDTSGKAYADFFAGTAPSNAGPITISAQVQGSSPVIKTGTAPSSSNVQLTIGGQATSVSFGASSQIRESSDKTEYMLDHSVQVTDAQGNAVSGAVVTLKVRPVAFSTGSGCATTSTYCTEDVNGNGSLDAGEDGKRVTTGVATTGSCFASPQVATKPDSETMTPAEQTAATAVTTGSSDGILTPINAYAGSVPATITTRSDGTGSFTLTYLKAASIWTVVKLTASVGSGTTETSNSAVFRLAPSVDDKKPGTCHIPDSPFAE